jgi:hypothetical protein
MFCPQCKAEYRQGFRRCSDCDVELVDNYVEAVQHRLAKKAVASEKYGTRLWNGSDPHFYMKLLSNLWDMKVDCYGAPENPPVPQAMRELPSGSSNPGGFEVWVSEENLPMARWILDSAAEEFEKNPPDGHASRTAEHELSPETVVVCPLCFAEFATASPTCPNCGVPLRPVQPDMAVGDSARLLCRIDHPKFTAELRNALKSEGVPFNDANVSGGGIIPGFLYSRHYAVAVLDNDFERAKRVMSRVLQCWEFEPGSGFGIGGDPLFDYWPVRATENGWFREDISALVWSAQNIILLGTIGRALQEHEIAYRVEAEPLGTAKVFIHAADEARARELVREVIEGPQPG